jgi:uncharacterized protein with GYD domain
MATYIALINWTDQGVKNFKDTVDRAGSAEEAIGKFGASFKDLYWTVGPYDLVTVVEAPDEETATAALLTIASEGNIRTTTLRAFSREEMTRVVEKATS